MTQWQYKVLFLDPRESEGEGAKVQGGFEGGSRVLDRYGKDGWELVQVNPAALPQFFLRRPVRRK